jgi:hypothetical protein
MKKYKCPECGKLYSFQTFTCCGKKPNKRNPNKYVTDESIELIDWEKELSND